jgi:hypothetical protein
MMPRIFDIRINIQQKILCPVVILVKSLEPPLLRHQYRRGTGHNAIVPEHVHTTA